MVYLDNAATTRPSRAVTEAMAGCLADDYFNPSAIYKPAVETSKRMESCRELIRRELQAERVIFTSGGTEANNLAILGSLQKRRGSGRALYSLGEHPSVKAPCQSLPEGIVPMGIPLEADGRVDLAALQELLSGDTLLVCVMQVNNETGASQPIEEISALIHSLCPRAWFHVDGVQGFLRVPARLKDMGIDSYSLSGHKIHGPKGIGALVLGSGKPLTPQHLGGGQEEGLRSGTENTPGIAGLMAAVSHFPKSNDMLRLKLTLYERLARAIPGLILNGPVPESPYAASHILNLSFPPVRAETMLHALEGKGVYVSHGSACSSRKAHYSDTLKAMGVSRQALEGAVRFSLSPDTTEEDIRVAAEACIDCYQALKAFSRR